MKHLLLDVKIVAHRMSTVERCDRIVSFRDKSIHLTEGINHVTVRPTTSSRKQPEQ